MARQEQDTPNWNRNTMNRMTMYWRRQRSRKWLSHTQRHGDTQTHRFDPHFCWCWANSEQCQDSSPWLLDECLHHSWVLAPPPARRYSFSSLSLLHLSHTRACLYQSSRYSDILGAFDLHTIRQLWRKVWTVHYSTGRVHALQEEKRIIKSDMRVNSANRTTPRKCIIFTEQHALFRSSHMNLPICTMFNLFVKCKCWGCLRNELVPVLPYITPAINSHSLTSVSLSLSLTQVTRVPETESAFNRDA